MTCPSCQVENPAGARFCSNCGAALAVRRPVEGERRLVTIMFADVVGSTSLAERVDPEVWAELMNGALGFMIDAVNRYEGTVGRLMGDAILALFGAPMAHEDDATRAVLAALEIRTSAARYAEGVKRDHDLDFAVRIGINTGLSVLAVVGDATKAEYTAMGDSVNLAARLQGLASPQGILIGPDTHALVRRAFDTRTRAPAVIRGKAEPLTTYEVIGPRTAAAGVGGVAGIESPLVGRDVELDRLEELFAAAQDGRGSLAVLVGEAGHGKSRLAAELRRRTTAASEESTAGPGGAPTRALWLETRGSPYSRTEPYHPWRHLLASHEVWVSSGAEAHGGADAEAVRRRIAEVVSGHLVELAANATVVVALEDLHWFDRASVDLLEAVSAALHGHRVLVLCLTRRERGTPVGDLLARIETGAVTAGEVAVIEVAALDRAAAMSLLDGMLEVVDMTPTTRTLILEKAEGNPFYLEEVVRSLIDSGHIARESGTWRLVRPIGDVDVPDTLSGVLSARIDRLPETARRVAQTASVIGREFESDILCSVMRDPSDAEPPDLKPDLDTLTAEDLINELQLADVDYRFKHELTRDAAYQRLLLRRRRELHVRVALELERRHADRLPDLADTLSRHYLLGESWLEAAKHGLRAARQAATLYAMADALEGYETVLDAVAHIDRGQPGDPARHADAGSNVREPGRQADELAFDALSGWLETAVTLRVHEDLDRRPLAMTRAEQAVALGRLLGDQRRLVIGLVGLGNVLALSGFPGTAFGPLQEAHDLAAGLGDENLFLLPFWAATEMMVDDDPAGAVKQFDEVVELARSNGNIGIEAHASATRAAALSRLGEFERAEESARHALEAVSRSGSIIKMADVSMLVGAAYFDMGRVTEALQHVERGRKMAEDLDGFECACSGYHLEGMMELRRLHLDEASSNLHRSLSLGVGTAFEPFLHNVRALLASTEFQDGGDEASVAAMEKEIANADARKDGFGASNARMELAAALLALGRAQASEPHVRRALQWYRERLMYPYMVRALDLLADVLEVTGARPQAAAARREAREASAALERSLPVGDPAPPGGDRLEPPAVE